MFGLEQYTTEKLRKSVQIEGKKSGTALDENAFFSTNHLRTLRHFATHNSESHRSQREMIKMCARTPHNRLCGDGMHHLSWRVI
jgi:hypothetical protein